MGGEEMFSPSKVLWRPNPKSTNMDKFRQIINSKYNLELDDYNDLYAWSVEEYDCFWEEFWKFSKIIHSQPYTQVVDKKKQIDEIPEWFQGARLNYAENLLCHNDDQIAIIAVSECKKNVVKKTYSELRTTVCKFAEILKDVGVKEGDRVAGYIPNCCEAVEAMLATASLGAIWTATSPDIGVSGILEKFMQVRPKVIFSVDAVIYNGKTHSHLDKLRQVSKQLPDLEKVIVIPCSNSKDLSIDIKSIPNCELLQDLLDKKTNPQPLQFTQVPFNHPLFILYSSGTTGVPKCMVHSVGGTLIQHLKEHILHGNMSRADKLMYFTTTGWMMWNWMVSSLAVGSTVVLYDGSPLYPHPAALWDIVDEFGITILGTGATWLSVLETKGLKPKNTHNLTTLHTILSTGSPLSAKSYRYVYQDIKKDVLLGSITGGTDIISCFIGQNPTVPVIEGELQSRNLSMAVESWNEEGKSVWGESGELVCLKPFPSMPTHFWNDPDFSKYRKAYFQKIPGVWSHGDYCKINPITGGVLMLGRSDGTLNPNGVRFGSAEIYNIVEMFKEVQDSLCVSQINKNGDERVILFLRMVPGYTFTADLVEKVRSTIRRELSVRHVPAIILETDDIPYTCSGKKVEIAVKKIISGEDVANRSAFANPDSLELYYNIPELKKFI